MFLLIGGRIHVRATFLLPFLAEKAILYLHINNTNGSFSYHSRVHQPLICHIHLNDAQREHSHSVKASEKAAPLNTSVTESVQGPPSFCQSF